MYEIKQTSEIKTVKDIENRFYHAFAVYRRMPPVKPQGYFNLWGKICGYASPENKNIFLPYDLELAEEVSDKWWPILIQKCPFDTCELIKYRCGCPIIDNTKTVWTGVRSWYDVSQEFHIHQNTAIKRWRKAMEYLLNNLTKYV